MEVKPGLTFKEYFYRIKKRHGLTVQKTAAHLAGELGCTQAYIIGLVYGWNRPAGEMAIAIEKHSRGQLDLRYLITMPKKKKYERVVATKWEAQRLQKAAKEVEKQGGKVVMENK